MTDEKVERQYKPKSDAELEQLAQDVYAGRVFTSAQCRPRELTMVFMMLHFLEPDDIAWMRDKADITLFYEEISKASPRSVNGLPCFLSLQYLNRSDHAKFETRYFEIKTLMDARNNATAK